jgi:hypothetical protein
MLHREICYEKLYREIHIIFWLENLKGRDHSEDVRMDIMETGWEGVGWMHLTQDSDQ